MDEFINNYIQILSSITTLIGAFTINRDMFSKSTINNGLFISFIVILLIIASKFTTSILFYITICVIILLIIQRKFYSTYKKSKSENTTFETIYKKLYNETILFIIARIIFSLTTLTCISALLSVIYKKNNNPDKYIKGLIYLLKQNQIKETNTNFVLYFLLIIFGIICTITAFYSFLSIFFPYYMESHTNDQFYGAMVSTILLLFSTYVLIGYQYINFHFKITLDIIQKVFFSNY